MSVDYIESPGSSAMGAQEERTRGGLIVDTVSVAPNERFSLWTSTGRDMYGQLAFRRSTAGPFRGKIHAHKVGSLQFVRTEADPITARVVHGPDARSGFTLKLNLYGQCHAGIAGHRVSLRPGDFLLYDRSVLDYVDCLGGGPWGQLDVHLPRGLVQPYAERLRGVTEVPLTGTSGLGQVLSRFLIGLDTTLRHDAAGLEDTYLADGTFELVLAMCLREQGTSFRRPGLAHKELLHNVKSYIEQHISEPDLQSSAIARENFVSIRLLYKLFESEGVSVGGWIKDRRLERCRQDLVDLALSDCTIAQIADRWGFKSPAHFSRLFHSKFGLSPSEYRRNLALRSPENPTRL